MEKYQVYHDCGKPLCLTYDEFGKKHFYNHSTFSYNQFLKVFPEDNICANLIKNDLEFHTNKDLSFLWSLENAHSLYLTAWAEIYANSEMFGGVESDSFKIKRKKLIKAGKYITK